MRGPAGAFAYNRAMRREIRALHTAAQVRELDRLAIAEAGIAGYELMCRAGRAAFEALREAWPRARRIVVLCGAGNNAGDGYVVARLARERGLEAEVLWLRDPAGLAGDAATAARDWHAAGGRSRPFDAGALAGADVVVDALLGTGLDRPLEGSWAAAVEALATATAPVLALDLPSGLHADTGAVLGAAVRADLTVTFVGAKRGLLTGEAPDHVGRLLYDDLDVPEAVLARVPPAALRVTAADVREVLPPRPRTAHKGRFGHVLVVGGNNGMAGAARLAGEGALRAGAGLVSVAVRSGHAAAIAAGRPELMARDVEGAEALAAPLARATVLAAGPGLGQDAWARALLARVLEAPQPKVLDADALNLLAAEPVRREDWVLTPHPGEAARLLGTDTATVQRDRFAAARALVERYGGVAVLKGAGTIVADARAVWVCDRGNPGLASGGTGDVLTGVIAGLLAQGLAPEEAARTGVWLHGAAADAAAACGERGMIASDLLAHVRGLANPD